VQTHTHTRACTQTQATPPTKPNDTLHAPTPGHKRKQQHETTPPAIHGDQPVQHREKKHAEPEQTTHHEPLTQHEGQPRPNTHLHQTQTTSHEPQQGTVTRRTNPDTHHNENDTRAATHTYHTRAQATHHGTLTAHNSVLDNRPADGQAQTRVGTATRPDNRTRLLPQPRQPHNTVATTTARHTNPNTAKPNTDTHRQHTNTRPQRRIQANTRRAKIKPQPKPTPI